MDTRRHSRALVSGGLMLFGASTLFPIVAGLLEAAQVPAWAGVVDVVLAFALVGWLIVIGALTQGKYAAHAERLSYRAALGVAQILLALLIVFFVAGEQVRWNVLLPGLAWRAWLLMMALPAAFTLWGSGAVS